MKLLTAELLQQLPPLYAQEHRHRSDRARQVLHAQLKLDLVCDRRECSI